MAKSLGQIHSVNVNSQYTAVNQKLNIDLPGQLTEQLNRMVRAGTFHKVVGIDMSIDPLVLGPNLGGQVTGRILYYAPTRGRCEAFRSAFKSMAEVMKTQGISMRDNKLYDFKAPINNFTSLQTFENQATLDGVNGLALNNSNAGSSIFGVHNAGIQPVSTPAPGDLFTAGFDTLVQGSGGTDFVLNDAIPYSGNPMFASLEYEEIPFSVVYDPVQGTVSNFQWRPDPALYVAVLCGQLQVVVDEITLLPGTSSLSLKVHTMVSGWKSIMGNPDKKRKPSFTSAKRIERKRARDGSKHFPR